MSRLKELFKKTAGIQAEKAQEKRETESPSVPEGLTGLSTPNAGNSYARKR